jgi:hypothetical protein
MTTNTTTMLTKEQLYDSIGQKNIRICKLEEEIPHLEFLLQQPTVGDEPETEFGIQKAIREKRNELEELKAEVRRCRLTIIGRLELEVEQMSLSMEQECISLGELARCRANHTDYVKEIANLKRLVTC